MSVLRITRYGEPVLREKARPVDDLGPKTQQLIKDMYETMYAASGIGLAAPQVGIDLRLAVINVTPDKRKNQFCIINPKIVEKHDTVDQESNRSDLLHRAPRRH
jgi:peptide deformylase